MAAPIDVCRVCNDCLPIKHRRVIFGETFGVFQQLTQVLDYRASPNDGLSKYVCGFCFTKLNKLCKIDTDLIHKMDSLRREKSEVLGILREKHSKTLQLIKVRTPKSQDKRTIVHSPTPRKSKRTLFSTPQKNDFGESHAKISLQKADQMEIPCVETLKSAPENQKAMSITELGYPNARALLNDDAIPDVPWATNKESTTRSNKTSRPYGAYRKRRRLEVLEELMKEEENIDAGNESNNLQNTSADILKNTSADISKNSSADNSISISADNSHELRDETSHELRNSTSSDSSTFESNSCTADKAVQVFIPDRSSKVKNRTRRIQTGRSYIDVKTTDSQVQCDEVRLCCNCLKSMESDGGVESVKSEDRSTYMIF